nr:unnamed protein product [Naegleria fowleri]
MEETFKTNHENVIAYWEAKCFYVKTSSPKKKERDSRCFSKTDFDLICEHCAKEKKITSYGDLCKKKLSNFISLFREELKSTCVTDASSSQENNGEDELNKLCMTCLDEKIMALTSEYENTRQKILPHLTTMFKQMSKQYDNSK